ncbi:MAG: hypothetical protein A2Y14_00390 [Verrucomicrobia bacterium GWF2_51_19]|nr:MAG: hypothetical protein A2Y14_00390 [Verrucomicrobia bacterium GWF2_51_19]HCJ12088.1 hypothetical protein [Opitutae bacterium]
MIFLRIALLLLLVGCQNPFGEEARRERQQKRINTAIEKANQKVAENDPKAYEAFDKLVTEYPESAEAIQASGFAYLKKQDFARAANLLEKAGQLSDESECFLYAGKAFLDANDFDGVVRNYKSYIAHYPDDTAVCRELAQAYLFLNDKKAALETYLTFASKDGCTDVDAATVGNLFLPTSSLQAEKWFQRALQLNPKSQDALLGKVRVDLLKNNWADLAQDVDALQSLNAEALKQADLLEAQEKVEAWKTLIAIQEAQRIAEEARKAKLVAPAVSPMPAASKTPPVVQAPPVPVSPAQKAFDEKHFDEASVLLQKAIAQGESTAHNWSLLAECFFQLAQYPQAEMTALEAIRKDPQTLAYTLQYLKMAQKTQPSNRFIEELIAAKERFPEAYPIHYALSKAYEAIGQKGQAAEAHQNYLKFAPKIDAK